METVILKENITLCYTRVQIRTDVNSQKRLQQAIRGHKELNRSWCNTMCQGVLDKHSYTVFLAGSKKECIESVLRGHGLRFELNKY